MKYVVIDFASMMDQTVEVNRSKVFDTEAEAQEYKRLYGRNNDKEYSSVRKVNDDGSDIEEEFEW